MKYYYCFLWNCLTCLSLFDFFRNVLWQYVHTLLCAFLFLFWLIFLQFLRCLIILRLVVALASQFSVGHKYRLLLGFSTFVIFRSMSSCTFMLVSIKASGELLITSPVANFHDCRVLMKCFLCSIQILLFFVIFKLENFFKKKTLHWQWLVRIMHQCLLIF